MSYFDTQDIKLESSDTSDLRFALTSTMFMLNNKQQSVSEADLIYEQNQLLKQIRAKFDNKNQSRLLTESDSTEFTLNKSSSQLFRPTIISRKSRNDSYAMMPLRPRNLNCSAQQMGKLRRRTSPTSEEIEQLVCEVKLNCTHEANETLNTLLKNFREMNKMLGETDNVHQLLDKEKKNLQAFRNQCEHLEKKLYETEQKLKFTEENTVPKETLERERKMHTANIAEKERLLVKAQTALLVKEKLLSEDVKKLKTKMNYIARQQRDLRQERKLLDGLWDEVLTRADGGRESVFRNHIYSKCKESLLKQRSAMAQQQQQLERHHGIIERIILQLQGVEVS